MVSWTDFSSSDGARSALLARRFDASGGDGYYTDSDCNDDDPDAQVIDRCGVCGGDESSCGIFADGFETGDFGAWLI